MTEIQYIKGDATSPQGFGERIITHIVNDVGAWGSGFTRALSDRWQEPEAKFRTYGRKFPRGEIQHIHVDEGIGVVNMYAQRGLIKVDDQGHALSRPLDDTALVLCLFKLGLLAMYSGASIHMPRIGCGLAGGKWSEVEPLIQMTLCRQNVPVTVYDLHD